LIQKGINSQNNGSYEIIAHSEEIRTINNLECVRSHRKWVDHGGPATNNTELTMLATGYICIHPESNYQLIEVSYSSRNRTGEVALANKEEGENFINSVSAVTIRK
ncbi:MAG: hypothetical protein P8045_17455, partial [Candidatus Thiodiazotropha sp.]